MCLKAYLPPGPLSIFRENSKPYLPFGSLNSPIKHLHEKRQGLLKRRIKERLSTHIAGSKLNASRIRSLCPNLPNPLSDSRVNSAPQVTSSNRRLGSRIPLHALSPRY